MCSQIVIVGNTLGHTWGLGVGQSVNKAAQLLVGHTLTEFFGQVF